MPKKGFIYYRSYVKPSHVPVQSEDAQRYEMVCGRLFQDHRMKIVDGETIMKRFLLAFFMILPLVGSIFAKTTYEIAPEYIAAPAR